MDWTRRTCCSAVLANRCCDDMKHAMRHRADCLNTYCKNMTFSIKWYVYNCLYSIPTLTGKHLHLRITHKRHVCEYLFLHKKWSSLHPYHFVGEVLLHPVYIMIKIGDSMAQAVKCLSPTAGVHCLHLGTPWGFCGGRNGAWVDFFMVSPIFPCHKFHSTISPGSSHPFRFIAFHPPLWWCVTHVQPASLLFTDLQI